MTASRRAPAATAGDANGNETMTEHRPPVAWYDWALAGGLGAVVARRLRCGSPLQPRLQACGIHNALDLTHSAGRLPDRCVRLLAPGRSSPPGPASPDR